MLEAGIQPVYVFDGKPPELKKQTLSIRGERKGEAEESLKKAQVSTCHQHCIRESFITHPTSF